MVQEAFYTINLAAFAITEGGVRSLTTKVLTEEEKKSRTLDYLTGFEIIDAEARMFVFEGLSGKALKRYLY